MSAFSAPIVARASFSDDSWSIGRVLERLHRSFIEDGELDDILNAILDPDSTLSEQDITELAPRLRKILVRLVEIAAQRNSPPLATELADLVRVVQDHAGPCGFERARGRLRLLAVAVVDVLDLVSDDEETSTPDFGALSAVPRGERS
ncbi:DUF6415 family natural product biosynthesis protein [Streptomyces sp. NPDC051569]|uniref:DUF6415 family natural product biosynthesis protein n=1 Tax=Streptomyces sp. NPDC051569 TaxID=3365661 RepID=UPI0037947DE2